jgi:hypothetical protein
MRKFVKACGVVMIVAGASVSSFCVFAAGPFAAFGGHWKGSGRIYDIHGRTEPLSCRSTNDPASDGIAMTLSLVCASDSYRIDFHSELYTDGHSLTGTWSEKVYEATGNMTGDIRPDSITAVAKAPGFDATIVAHIAGANKLDVTLKAHGVSIDHVVAVMKR